MLSILAPKPSVFSPPRFWIIFSIPSKAPPNINNTLVVSIFKNSWCGCFLPPWGGTLATVPSNIFNSACWTPSPLTSLVIDGFSDFLAILSISSIYIIPLSAFSISKSADWISFKRIFSTSYPTYQASVSDVASAIAKGTFNVFAKVWASKVFPEPVGPNNNILLFCISISLVLAFLL